MEKLNRENELVQMIMRQTDYTEDIAREKLIENKYDTILVIKKYMGLNDTKPEVIKSVIKNYKKSCNKNYNKN